jgi:hypothetical protein
VVAVSPVVCFAYVAMLSGYEVTYEPLTSFKIGPVWAYSG